MIKRLLLLILLAAVPVLVTHPHLALASAHDQILDGVKTTTDGSSPPASNLDDTISAAIKILSVIVGIAAIFMIIIAGLRYITSGGNPDKTKGAKNALLYALVGLVIVALAQTIAHFVLNQAVHPGS